ncbi:MAG: DNA-processing protein DprA [Microcoleaceae cyanobacterium]
MLQERDYWVCWSRISGIGPISLQRLQQQFGCLKEAWTASASALQQVEGFGKQTVEKVVQQRSQFNTVEFIQQHAAKNPQFWTPADAEYPRLLLEIPTPPPVLYYRGIPQLQENQGITPTVAIVGTRHSTEYGRRWTRKITFTLAKRGFTIVSGMAAGIDTEAHRSCLQIGKRTVAVFGTGVDVIYPKKNEQLSQQIVENGLILSEYPAGTQPNSRHFPVRNRIVAGLSRAIFVMEAGLKSGASITANIANEFGRDVYVLPGRLDDEQSMGCLKLINGGAGIIPVNLEELLEQLGDIPPLDIEPSQQLYLEESTPEPLPQTPQLEPQLATVLNLIPPKPMPFDAIVEQAKLDTATVSSGLLQLELLGLVSQLPGMRYQRN